MRALAVDFGERRIGLAVSDPSGQVVVPVGILLRRSDAEAAAAVTAAAREREVEVIVIGIPGGSAGEEHPFARRVRNFARRLAEASGIRVETHGEDFTSVAAASDLVAAGLPVEARRRGLDAEAAAGILRDYLSRLPRPAPAKGPARDG